MEMSPDNGQKRYENNWKFAAPKSFFTVDSQKQFTSFSNQHSILSIRGLQHYCFSEKQTGTDFVDFGKCRGKFGPGMTPSTWI